LDFTKPSPPRPPAGISNKQPKQGCYPNPARNPSVSIDSDNPHPDAKLRIHAYRELADAKTPKSIDTLEKNWIDRHGRLPEPVKNLLTIARIKAEAASNKISSVEISGQRLMLQRNGSPILMDGSRYPRLAKTKPGEKLE
jgi:transcription-repair coupling factor (superfamily II helicase)